MFKNAIYTNLSAKFAACKCLRCECVCVNFFIAVCIVVAADGTRAYNEMKLI